MNQMTGKPHSSAGFTLIELMIAMLIALVVSAGAIQLFSQSIAATTRASEIQQGQQTLLAVIEHMLPRIREANTLNSNPDDPNHLGLQITRRASNVSPGYNCTGAPVGAGANVTERYYSDGTDLLCESDGRTVTVAFNITGISVNQVFEDTTEDGRGDTAHSTGPFPEGETIMGAEILIEQPLVDNQSRTIPLHIALRNNVMQARNKNGDFAP